MPEKENKGSGGFRGKAPLIPKKKSGKVPLIPKKPPKTDGGAKKK
jgi:hypothetical protein